MYKTVTETLADLTAAIEETQRQQTALLRKQSMIALRLLHALTRYPEILSMSENSGLQTLKNSVLFSNTKRPTYGEILTAIKNMNATTTTPQKQPTVAELLTLVETLQRENEALKTNNKELCEQSLTDNKTLTRLITEKLQDMERIDTLQKTVATESYAKHQAYAYIMSSGQRIGFSAFVKETESLNTEEYFSMTKGAILEEDRQQQSKGVS